MTSSLASIFIAFLPILLLIYILKLLAKNYSFLSVDNRPTFTKVRGPWSWPLFGTIHLLPKLKPEHLLETIQCLRNKYGCTFRLWIGPKLWVYLHTPQEMRAILFAHSHKIRRADSFQFLKPLIGSKNLFLSEGEEWFHQRKLLNRAFTSSNFDFYEKKIKAHCATLIEKWSQRVETKQNLIEVSEDLFACMVDTLMDTILGENLQLQSDPNDLYIKSFHQAGNLLFKRMINPFLHWDWIYRCTSSCRELSDCIQIIHKKINSIINELRQNTANDSTKSNFMKILLENEHVFSTSTHLQDQVNTFLFAGVDTTASAMSFILYALAKFPKEQEKLLFEIKKQEQEELETKNAPTYQYLELFIKECLRYYTIVPLTGRESTKWIQIGNIWYPPKTTFWLNVHGLNHDSQLFHDPYEFKPLRFLAMSENDEHYSNFYLPFSNGPHKCIGRNLAWLIMKIFTKAIIKQFKISLPEKSGFDLILLTEMVLKSKNGIHLKLEQRK